jgi:hypothetical protein
MFLDDDTDEEDESEDVSPSRNLQCGGILPKKNLNSQPQTTTWLPDMLEVIRTPETPRQLKDEKFGGGLSELKPFASERTVRSGVSGFPSTTSTMASHKSTASGMASRSLRRINDKKPARKAHPKILGPKNIKSKFKREYDGTATVRTMLEPDLRLQSWLNNFQTEQQSFESIAVYAEAKLSEVRSATAGLSTPNAYRTAVCCDILGKMRLLFGRYDHLMVEVMKEILSSIYIDCDALMGAHILPSGAEQLLHLGTPYFEDWIGQKTRLELAERKLMLWETKRKDMETMLSKSLVVLKVAIRTWQRLYLSRFMDEWRIWLKLRKKKLVRFQRQRKRIWFFGWKYKSRESKMMRLLLAAEDAAKLLEELKEAHAKKLSELNGMIEALRNENAKMKGLLETQAKGLSELDSLADEVKRLKQELETLAAAMKSETDHLSQKNAKLRKMYEHEQAWRIKLELEVANLKKKLASGGGGGNDGSEETAHLMEVIATMQAQIDKLTLDMRFLNNQNADLLEQIAQLTAGDMITVGPGHEHNFPSISAAMASAKAGDTIVVNPGTYPESVDLKAGVKIMSVGSAGHRGLGGQVVTLGGGKKGFDFGEGRLTDSELRALRERIAGEWKARNGEAGDEATFAAHALLTQAEKDAVNAAMQKDKKELARLKALVEQRNRDLANLNARLLKAGGNYIEPPVGTTQATQTTEDSVVPTQWLVSDVDGVSNAKGEVELHFEMTNVTDDVGLEDIVSYDVYWENADDPSDHGTIMVTADMLEATETDKADQQLAMFEYDIGETVEIDLDRVVFDEIDDGTASKQSTTGNAMGNLVSGKQAKAAAKKKGKAGWQKSKVTNRYQVLEKVDGKMVEVTRYDVELEDGTTHKNVRNTTSEAGQANLRHIGGKGKKGLDVNNAQGKPLKHFDISQVNVKGLPVGKRCAFQIHANTKHGSATCTTSKKSSLVVVDGKGAGAGKVTKKEEALVPKKNFNKLWNFKMDGPIKDKSLPQMHTLIAELYGKKIIADEIDDRDRHTREGFQKFTIGYLQDKYGVRKMADQHLRGIFKTTQEVPLNKYSIEHSAAVKQKGAKE